MRALTIFYFLFALLSVSAGVDGALVPGIPPMFETLFLGPLGLGDFQTVANGTFGTRLHGVVTGGNLTDPSGKPVATILPTADTGLISNSGILFPDAVLPLVWTADSKLAHLRVQGVGIMNNFSLSYVHLETDSEVYSYLNGRFLISSFIFSQEGPPILSIFGAL